MSDIDKNNASLADVAREQLNRIEVHVLRDAAIALGCKDVGKHAAKVDLIDLIINCRHFRVTDHLGNITVLEALIREKAQNKRIESRFDEQVRPLIKSSSRIQSTFVTIGTVASVILSVSALYGFNLNAKLVNQQVAFEQNRKDLEEDLSDLHKVREESRRDRRDEMRDLATLQRFSLQAEIIDFEKALKHILSLSLNLQNDALKDELENIKPDIDRWKRLTQEAMKGVNLEAKREWKIVEMQIEFIEAVERFVGWREASAKDWTPTHDILAKLDRKLEALQQQGDDRYLELQELLERADRTIGLISVEENRTFQLSKEESQKRLAKQVGKELKDLNDRLGVRAYAAETEFSHLITKARSYTYVMLARIERLSPGANLDSYKLAIEYATKASRLDSASSLASGELAVANRKMAKYLGADSPEFEKYFWLAIEANKRALAQTDPGVYPRDALILMNNLAYNYLRWAEYGKKKEITQKRIEEGIEVLEDIDDKNFEAVGTIRKVSHITTAELLIAQLFLEIESETESSSHIGAWQEKECKTLDQPLTDLLRYGMSSSVEGGSSGNDKNTYERVSEIYQHLDAAGEFGRKFFRRKLEPELAKASPYLCAFAKLDLVKGTGIGTPAASPQEREENLWFLQQQIKEMFQLNRGKMTEQRVLPTGVTGS